MEQNGHRFLQKKFVEGSPVDIEKTYSKTFNHVIKFMTDIFGKYVGDDYMHRELVLIKNLVVGIADSIDLHRCLIGDLPAYNHLNFNVSLF
jgi:hypothetical protein